jgi:ATP-dependent Lon protease
VLPVGGLREKLMAAHRNHMKTVLIPRRNKKDLTELPRNVQRDLDLALVERMDEILARALLPAQTLTPKPKRSTRRRKAEIQPSPEAIEAPAIAVT